MLYFPPLLAGQILLPGIMAKGVIPFISFSLASSAGYVFNDLIDRERDIHHPHKRHRLIASGGVTPRAAALSASVLFFFGLLMAGTVSLNFVFFVLAYALVSLLYSLKLKNIPLLDLFSISSVFLIRLKAGGELFVVPVSPWLFLTVFLLSVFLSAGKRLGEANSLGEKAAEHRVSLAHYPKGFLDGTMYLTGAAVLVTYAMYALNRHTLIYSVPLCLFGLLRFIFRVSSGKNSDPTDSLLKDRFLLAVGLLWVLMVMWSIYWL